MPWNKMFHPMEQSVPPHGTNRKVPPPWVEGAASVGRRCRLRGSKVPPPRVEGAAFERRRYGLQEVVVYSREPQVRLYLNGQQVGTQSTSEITETPPKYHHGTWAESLG